MKYKIVFIDADNTLLDSAHNISEVNKQAIQKARNAGVKVIICSGRSYVNILDFLKDLGIENEENYVSSFNGGVIVKTQGNTMEVMRQEPLKRDDALTIIEELRKYPVQIMAYNDPTYTIIENETEFTDLYYSVTQMRHEIVSSFADRMNPEIPKMMALGYHDQLETLVKVFSEQFGDRINVFFSMETMIEFTSKNATKGNSLLYLCDLLGISPEEAIAIGDSHNDISMIKNAGLGIAVANASDEIKSYADYITTATNNESAVAEALNKFINIE